MNSIVSNDALEGAIAPSNRLKPEHIKYFADRACGEAIAHLNAFSIDDKKAICAFLGRKEGGWRGSGGWIAQGVDPATGKIRSEGLQFRPDVAQPQRQKDKSGAYVDVAGRDGKPKMQKFLSRSKAAAPIFLAVPDRPQFWAEVLGSAETTLIITEGIAKAMCLLERGLAAISIPGVACGQKDGALKPDLKAFCQADRKFLLAFDADLHRNPDVNRELARLGSLLEAEGCKVSIALWDEAEGKGLDDLIAANGFEAFQKAIEAAKPFAEWKQDREGEKIFSASRKGGREPVQLSTNIDVEGSFGQIAAQKLYSDARWICVADQLYQWTGTYYEHRKPDLEIKRINALADSLWFQKGDKPKEYPFARPQIVVSALNWVKQKFSVSPDDCNPPGLNCTNGVLLIRWEGGNPEFKLIPHSPDRYYTYEPLAHYDPNAPTEDCDRLLAALDEPQQQVMLRTIAAALDIDQVRRRHGRMVRAVFARGMGSNGKDAWREATSLLWGRSGVTSVALEDFSTYDGGKKFPLIPLLKSRVNWASENVKGIPIDALQSLKRATTGEALYYERKGVDAEEFIPKAIQIFNINDLPTLKAGQDAIKTRYAIVTFGKTYVDSPDPAKGQLKADPRFKYDPEFIQKNVLPAFLNRVLQAFKDLMAEGIDYSCCDAAMQAIQIQNSHLFEFAQSAGLSFDKESIIPIGELWAHLERFYFDSEILTAVEDKRIWAEDVRPGDPYVKGANQLFHRLSALYPAIQLVPIGKNKKGIKGLKMEPPTATPEPIAPEPMEPEAATPEPIAIDSTQARQEASGKTIEDQWVDYFEVASRGSDEALLEAIACLQQRSDQEFRRQVWRRMKSRGLNQLRQRIRSIIEQRAIA